MSTIKTVGIFSVGFVCGAYVTSKYLNKKLDERFAEELDAMKDFYENSTDQIKKRASELGKEINKKLKFHTTLEKPEYDSYFHSEEDTEEDPAESEHPQDDKADPQPAYLISQSEYYQGYFEKRILTYYESVDILCEEDDILENIQYIVGDEFRDHFGDEEENVVYVRNEMTATDFEIILDKSDPDTVQEILGYEDRQ